MGKHKRYRPDNPSVPLQALSLECCQPNCRAPASNAIASQVPLCNAHIFDVYRCTNRILAVTNPPLDEYALLPSEQHQVPGPCPSCGLAGYLMVTVTDLVRCLNASCTYEAHIVPFELLRRRLMFDLAKRRNVVYYMKFRDCVKIGTTRNLERRWNDISGVESLYGFEWGNHQLEHRRHAKFAPYRTCGEWFKDNQEIRAHINNVCEFAA